jgi:hypothetical protein
MQRMNDAASSTFHGCPIKAREFGEYISGAIMTIVQIAENNLKLSSRYENLELINISLRFKSECLCGRKVKSSRRNMVKRRCLLLHLLI